MKSQPLAGYSSNDVVMTPLWLAEKIVTHYNPQGRILEPCKGSGNFLKYMPSAEWCELSEGVDFMAYTKHVDWIITNPPWSKIRDFLTQGFKVSDNVVYLFTINHAWTNARIRLMKSAGFGINEIILLPKIKEFPPMGFQLGVIHYKRGHVNPTTITDWT